MTDRLDGIATIFAEECAELGLAGFSIRTMMDGGVRLVGLQLPTSLVVSMLRKAADGYERQVGETPLN